VSEDRFRPIPSALRHRFQIDYTPSSLLEYDPEAFALPEIAAALEALRAMQADTAEDLAPLREWAALEWTRATAAALGSKAQPPAGKALDRELAELFAQIEDALRYAGPSATVAVSESVASSGGYFDAALLLREPGRALRILFLGDVRTLQKGDELKFRPRGGEWLPAHDRMTPYRICATLRGLTLANARQRISRYRDRAGEKLRRDRLGRGDKRIRVPDPDLE
jgi:hypothetical protein